MLIKKLLHKEDEVLRDDYIQELMKMLCKLGQNSKFNIDKMIFVPELIGSQGMQSAIDFIQHSPVSGSKIEIYTLITSEDNLKNI